MGVCAKGIKKELNTLDEADFVRDVENRDYHYLSQCEIAGAIEEWLLKNSLTGNLQKLDRVRKLYKRFFRVSWTFSITRFSTFFRKTDFFNSHRIYQ